MIEVAAAIIENRQGYILIARRKKGKSQEGLWEFPGGKLEPGESPEACLKRELMEEMNIEIAAYELFGVNEHDYGAVQIKLIAYRAKYLGGEIRLADHDEYRWASHAELGEYLWAPADVPFVELLGNLSAEGSGQESN
ncbi:8-oxo-dGTP diphosphatase MutT [Cohnella faecalis]|uniref:8-oxo-dGTP diphosphatase n=1 Tax=Cohnella faecalis TaxID=2315694 RepID=A0A398CEB8_9BACL|nr:8-oxo-dGTP diphosphatase MutT [Cohnella faecalis]RIE00202.1 8-oxo-dGTP diphosphatase MutT [Cohnella faecalis]